MDWTKHSSIAIAVYTALIDLGQIDPALSFEAAGTLTMADLQFFNITAGNDPMLANIKMLATSLDSNFINNAEANYQPGVDKAKAVNAMAMMMINARSTVTDLAGVADRNYNLDNTNNTGPKYY